MFIIDYPVPTLELMPIYYKNVAVCGGVPSEIYLLVRYNDTYYNPEEPTKENIVELKKPFGNSIFLEELKDISSYAVAEYGIFYVKYKKGLFYLHKSGANYFIREDSDICHVSYNDKVIKTYKIQEVRQVGFYEHFDTLGGLCEEWRDKYKIEMQVVNQFSYEKICKWVEENENKRFAEFNQEFPGLNVSKLMNIGYTTFCWSKKESAKEIQPSKVDGKVPGKVPDGIRAISVEPLFYKKRLFGYRFLTELGKFDMRAEAAEKYGLEMEHVSMENGIELIHAYYKLLSAAEIKNTCEGKMLEQAEDISNCEEDCKKLIQLLADLSKKPEIQNLTSVLSEVKKTVDNQENQNQSNCGANAMNNSKDKGMQMVNASHIFCMSCGQELPVNAKFCFNCGSEVKKEESNSNNVVSISNNVGNGQNNSQMTLLEFRQNAPQMTGYRNKLLEYRKSLSNSWDYSAYVGILLGVGGSKHGDDACSNYAIGQGDNGNNTKKTLEAKGLMPVFEKYKGKKIDASILLSDVENEIVVIAPEYAQIRQKLNTIFMNDNSIQSVVPHVRKFNTEGNTVKPKIPCAEPMITQKNENIPCHEVYYSFPIIFKLSGTIHGNWRDREYYNMVQEYNGDLYYAEYDTNNWTITCCRCNVTQNGKVERLVRFSSEEYYARTFAPNFGRVYEGVNICRAGGIHRAFCVYKDRIYYSACQMSANCSNDTLTDNTIWSMDLNGNDKRIELEINKNMAALFCPYVTETAFIFEEGYWIDRRTKEKKHIKKGGKIRYLSINETEIIAIDKDNNVFSYNFETDKRTPIEKVYKGSKGKDIIYIDGEKDILYYFENGQFDYENKSFTCGPKKDIGGKIIGIAKDGTIVDVWEGLNNYRNECLEVNGENYRFVEGFGYSAFLFDGKNRVYKNSAEKFGEPACRDSIFCVDRKGQAKQLYKKEWDLEVDKDGESINSVVHMLTPNYFISHVAEGGCMARQLHIEKKGLERAFPLDGRRGYISLF